MLLVVGYMFHKCSIGRLKYGHLAIFWVIFDRAFTAVHRNDHYFSASAFGQSSDIAIRFDDPDLPQSTKHFHFDARPTVTFPAK